MGALGTPYEYLKRKTNADDAMPRVPAGFSLASWTMVLPLYRYILLLMSICGELVLVDTVIQSLHSARNASDFHAELTKRTGMKSEILAAMLADARIAFWLEELLKIRYSTSPLVTSAASAEECRRAAARLVELAPPSTPPEALTTSFREKARCEFAAALKKHGDKTSDERILPTCWPELAVLTTPLLSSQGLVQANLLHPWKISVSSIRKRMSFDRSQAVAPHADSQNDRISSMLTSVRAVRNFDIESSGYCECVVILEEARRLASVAHAVIAEHMSNVKDDPILTPPPKRRKLGKFEFTDDIREEQVGGERQLDSPESHQSVLDGSGPRANAAIQEENMSPNHTNSPPHVESDDLSPVIDGIMTRVVEVASSDNAELSLTQLSKAFIKDRALLTIASGKVPAISAERFGAKRDVALLLQRTLQFVLDEFVRSGRAEAIRSSPADGNRVGAVDTSETSRLEGSEEHIDLAGSVLFSI
eukprot:TRINITY_DN11382_c0_g1_i1.p1 TRINITY_DN11382_c0_g1~~TRINITY_DN11382_c0_g1_i1.p1  ORF type:complete len:478 (-),score=68.53 TRINITY_DN11382_c0_g1_i1:55-1488(-)